MVKEAVSSPALFQLVSIPRGRGDCELRLWSFGANWVGAAGGAELSAGGRDQVSSLAPGSLRTAPASARAAETDGSLVFFSSPAQNAGAGARSAWDPRTLHGRKPEGMDGPQPRPAHLTSPNPCLEAGPGARERRTVNLGGLERQS